jgi:hypothetical protein
MIKIFFAVFFIAEMIIALAVILKIYQFDKKAIALNKAVLKSQINIRIIFHDIKSLLEDFNIGLLKLKELIRLKKEEYLIKISKRILIFIGFLSLKGKYKNMFFAYHVGKEIYEGFVGGLEI